VRHNLIFTGDINLLGVTDPSVPFARVRDRLHAADVVFANLECCFYEPDGERSPEDEGFYAPLQAAEALRIAGVHAVGNANNVNYGAPAIRSSLKRLDELGILHTGAGVNLVKARQPVIIERAGVRCGFLQRTSVYWSHGHEATATYPGVATLKAHTAYRPQIEQLRTLTRPGMPPEVVTWADPAALAQFRADMAALRSRADEEDHLFVNTQPPQLSNTKKRAQHLWAVLHNNDTLAADHRTVTRPRLTTPETRPPAPAGPLARP
jgi:poly-gamma-glutamate synthesis protein (capsule biosynthesis protein)